MSISDRLFLSGTAPRFIRFVMKSADVIETIIAFADWIVSRCMQILPYIFDPTLSRNLTSYVYIEKAVFGNYFLKYLWTYCTELNAVFGVN